MGSLVTVNFDCSSESLGLTSNKRNQHTGKTKALQSFSRWCGLFHARRRLDGHLKTKVTHQHVTKVSSTLIMDLRSTCDFRASHIPDSASAPLPGLYEGLAGGDLFGDPQAVSKVWMSMQKWLKEPEVSQFLKEVNNGKKKVLVLCYDGFASQLVGSVLRYQNVEAFSVRGGVYGAMWTDRTNTSVLRVIRNNFYRSCLCWTGLRVSNPLEVCELLGVLEQKLCRQFNSVCMAQLQNKG